MPSPADQPCGDGRRGNRQPRSLSSSSRFKIGEQDFLLDGEPIRVLSGALHYFRVRPEQWGDRLRKARQMGLNAIDTYVAWNAHEPARGKFSLSGGLDLGRFIDLAAEEGLWVIIRPGPYICAEWSGGGLPAWLPEAGVRQVRSAEPAFMSETRRYLERICDVIGPRQIDQGGPVIMVQVENEYGAFGSDRNYLRKLVQVYRGAGISVPFVTVDQPVGQMLENGGLPEVLRTGSFGGHTNERLDALRRQQPHGPLMVMEFWNGWFDSWGDYHNITPVEAAAAELETVLARGASVNFYMFHGGTNFGFGNGANDKGLYKPIVTSYDYDAPLDERGNPTAKYWAFREVIGRYVQLPDEQPHTSAKSPIFDAKVERTASLWNVVDELGTWIRFRGLPTADTVGSYDGFTLYRATLKRGGRGVLVADEVRDRAQVFVDRVAVGVLSREDRIRAITLDCKPGAQLELLVEDQGRVDYGPRLAEQKGLIGAVSFEQENLTNWEILNIDLCDLSAIEAALVGTGRRVDATLAGPLFAAATFELNEPADLHLSSAGWGKGVAWINGFCLGRYWSRGPQRTLYVPQPLLRAGENQLLMLELEAAVRSSVSFVAGPDVGEVEE